MKLKLYYSVQNCGDGSAYPRLMESMELAAFDQAHMGDAWGEPCTGVITLESKTAIKCLEDVLTKEGYFIDQYVDGGNAGCQEFIDQFFPDGLPVFSVGTEDVVGMPDYLYNLVFVNGKQVGKVFRPVKDSGQVFEDLLNTWDVDRE